MKTWLVTLPIVGKAFAEVEADTAEGAIEAAFESRLDPDEAEWEAVRQIVQGNVFHGEINTPDARCIDDGDDEE